MSFLLTSVVTVLTFAAIYFHLKKFTFWSSRGIGGPTPLPFFGTNHYYLFYNKVDIERKWAQEYGRVYGIYQGYKPMLKVGDNELIKQIFIRKFASFTDRDSSSIYGNSLKRWLFWTKGDMWASQRALVTPLFSSSKMRAMVDNMNACKERFYQYIANTKRKQNGAAAIKDKTISRDEMMALTLDVLAQSFFSLKIDTYKDKNSEFCKRAFAFASFDIIWSCLWLVIPSAVCKYFQIDLVKYNKYEYFDKLSKKIIDERRHHNIATADGETKKRADMIDLLLAAKIPDQYENVYTEEDDADAHYNDNQKHTELEKINESQNKVAKFRKFSDQEIVSQMNFFFLAGFETTSGALSFCFYELGHQQAAQEELHQELTAHMPRGQKQFTQYSDLLQLKKLDAFVSEALRLYSPTTNVSRVVSAKEGCTLESDSLQKPINLPYGCILDVNPFVYQRDPEYWREPTKFDMTRFYPENKDKIRACTYMPFGIGPRNCAGMRFALLEIRLMLANVLLKYRVYPGPNSQMYPPEFKRHFFFLHLKNTDTKLVVRE